MPESYLRALLLATVPTDGEPKKLIYKKPKPKRIHYNAGHYLKAVIESYQNEERFFWQHIKKQHKAIEKALKLEPEDYALLFRLKPRLSDNEVRLLDVPSNDRGHCFRLTLKAVSSPKRERVLLLLAYSHNLKHTLRRFTWGDDLSAYFKTTGFFKSSPKQQLSLKHMTKFEKRYGPILNDERLLELVDILENAVTQPQ